MRTNFLRVVALLFATQITALAQVAIGGPYALQQKILAGGGGSAAGGVFGAELTTGEAIAGTTSSGDAYSVTGGFWTAGAFAPTSANASIGGRVTSSGGGGISRVVVTLVGGPLTVPRVVTTNSFGYFTIPGVPVGHFYIVTVQHKRYTFSPDSHAFSLVEEITDVEFQAEELTSDLQEE